MAKRGWFGAMKHCMSVNRYVCLSRPTADKEILEAVIKNLGFSSYIMTSRTDKKSKKQGSPAFLMLHRFSGRGIATETQIFYYSLQGKPGTVALEKYLDMHASLSQS